MGQYHFDDHSFSDAFVTSTLATPLSVDSYHFHPKEYPHVYIRNRGLAISLSFKAEDSDEKKELKNSIEEYNEYLKKLEEIPGFIDYFVKQGLCTSKEDVSRRWSEEIANLVFSKKEYCFDTELEIINGCLFDNSYPVNYKTSIEGTDVIIPIGKNADSYPTSINGETAIWNWVDSGYDFCFALWRLLGEPTNQKTENEEEDDDAVNYWCFDYYDQIRHDPPNPQLVNIFMKLESMGYIQTYTIKPDKEDPRWTYFGKENGSIDLGLVDMSFRDDKELVDQIIYLLWQRIDSI